MKRVRVIRRRHIRNGRPVQLVVERILRFRKLLDGLPHAASELGQFLCAEKKEDDNEYDEHIGAGEVSEESEHGRGGHSFVTFSFCSTRACPSQRAISRREEFIFLSNLQG